jgi:hypothetical protein
MGEVATFSLHLIYSLSACRKSIKELDWRQRSNYHGATIRSFFKDFFHMVKEEIDKFIKDSWFIDFINITNCYYEPKKLLKKGELTQHNLIIPQLTL